MNEFAVTFADHHRHRGHPVNKKAHPDGYAVVEALDAEAALSMAHTAFGPYFREVYPLMDLDCSPSLFPRGETLRLK